VHQKGSLAARSRSPRALGRDARHVHVVQRDDGECEPDVPDGDRATRAHSALRRRAGGAAHGRHPRPAALRGLARGCSFTFRTRIENLARALSAATGWNYRLEDALRFGRRTAAILRAFNLRCGIGPEVEYPSERYGSQPVDGPAKDHNVMAQWE